MEDKQKTYSYYLKRCEELNLATDLFDFNAEIGEDLSYIEGINQLEEDYFKKLPSRAEVTLNEIKEEEERFKAQIKEKERQNQINYNENWALLSKARSIYILGSPRTGKSNLAFGLAKLLQPYKKIYYFNFPDKELLRKEKFLHLDNLNDLSLITDSVVVMDEIALFMRKYEKRTNEELQKILSLAGQNNLTIIFITQLSQMVNRSLEALIDCYFVLDVDYSTIKQGSKIKNMIKDYSTFSPEHFRLKKGEFLFYSRNFPVFENFGRYENHPNFTESWSFAYKNTNKGIFETVKKQINWLNFEKCENTANKTATATEK